MSNFIAKLAAFLFVLSFPSGATATWTPEDGFKPSPVVKTWFDQHKYCCLQAERVKTKFRAIGKGQWEYLTPDGWRPLNPVYPIDGGIAAPKGYEHEAEGDVQFKQLRAEGVLFVYNGRPFCFFEPETGG